jgi:hypothetical protein
VAARITICFSTAITFDFNAVELNKPIDSSAIIPAAMELIIWKKKLPIIGNQKEEEEEAGYCRRHRSGAENIPFCPAAPDIRFSPLPRRMYVLVRFDYHFKQNKS